MTDSPRVMSGRRRRRVTRAGVLLSEDLIVSEAIRISQLHGPEGMSMRRLGAAIGCDPTAIYRYFGSADDLLLAVCDRLIGSAMAGFDPGEHWADGLREMARRIHASFCQHPRLALLIAVRATGRDHELRAVETGVSLLLRAGFSPAEAVRYYAAFADMMLGHAALDAFALALPPRAQAADERVWARTYAGLDAESYPALAAAREHVPRLGASSFDHAVELLISAIAAKAPS